MTETPTPTEGYKPTLTETRRRWAMRQAADLIRARGMLSAGELDVDAAVTLADWLLETEADTAARHADDAARAEAVAAAYRATIQDAPAPPVPAATGPQVVQVKTARWINAMDTFHDNLGSGATPRTCAQTFLADLGIRVECQA